ncbi:small multi-drug export protein [Paenibacillus pasadenensis]|uniref:small multi-drug export protein n=1 Tax=Paenibacillus pasadenensis TaxID=217090 RepID=UPI00203B65AF|nr:small multi-drug export protein [Paenibacillus pasadenensis]MCM3749758.1 small multi-drug export protein [Paenibacillus pasadenensis]
MNIESILEGVRESNLFIQLGAVFLLSLVPFLEGYVAASVGILIGFPTVLTIIAASVGNWLSVMAVVVLYEKMRQRRKAKPESRRSGKKKELARKLFNKYGVPGVALFGPLVFGHHIGAFISLASGATKRYVTLWMTIGILAWTVVIGILASIGIDLAGRYL